MLIGLMLLNCGHEKNGESEQLRKTNEEVLSSVGEKRSFLDSYQSIGKGTGLGMYCEDKGC